MVEAGMGRWEGVVRVVGAERMEVRREERVVRVVVRAVVREVEVEWRVRMRWWLSWWVDTRVVLVEKGGVG